MVELAVRMVVSLAVVLGLLLLIARLGQRRFKGRTGSPLKVIHRQSLSRGSGVALVSVGGRMLLLGTTDQQVQMLTEVDPADLAASEATEATPAAAPVAPTADAPVAVADSLLGSMARLVEEPTRWLQPRGAKKRNVVITEPVVAAVPSVVPSVVPPVAAPVLVPVPAVAQEAQITSFAATLEAELEAELKAAVATPVAPRLTPAQVLLQEEPDQGLLAGSLLSPDTWRLAARAVSRRAS